MPCLPGVAARGRSPAPAGTSTPRAASGVPTATAAVRVTGPDRNLNGIPDALEVGGARRRVPIEPSGAYIATPRRPTVGYVREAASLATASVRAVGVDYNRNGIPDILDRGCTRKPRRVVQRARSAPPQLVGKERVVAVNPLLAAPAATANVRRPAAVPVATASAQVTGPDRNLNGIPDVLENGGAYPVAAGGAPMATANVKVIGADQKFDGIPDILQPKVLKPSPMYINTFVPAGTPTTPSPRRPASISITPSRVPIATAKVQAVGLDLNRNGIPDFMEQKGVPAATPKAVANVKVIGADRNLNGIPDCLEGGKVYYPVVGPGKVPQPKIVPAYLPLYQYGGHGIGLLPASPVVPKVQPTSAHPQCGGHGVRLPSAPAVVWMPQRTFYC